MRSTCRTTSLLSVFCRSKKMMTNHQDYSNCLTIDHVVSSFCPFYHRDVSFSSGQCRCRCYQSHRHHHSCVICGSICFFFSFAASSPSSLTTLLLYHQTLFCQPWLCRNHNFPPAGFVSDCSGQIPTLPTPEPPKRTVVDGSLFHHAFLAFVAPSVVDFRVSCNCC